MFKIKKSATILLIETIKPTLDFFENLLNFKVIMAAPEGNTPLSFALLQYGDIEVQLQTLSSAITDLPNISFKEPNSAALYFDVDNISEIENLLLRQTKIKIVKPKHTTSYGSTEIWVLEPGGHLVGFAQLG